MIQGLNKLHKSGKSKTYKIHKDPSLRLQKQQTQQGGNWLAEQPRGDSLTYPAAYEVFRVI